MMRSRYELKGMDHPVPSPAFRGFALKSPFTSLASNVSSLVLACPWRGLYRLGVELSCGMNNSHKQTVILVMKTNIQ